MTGGPLVVVQARTGSTRLPGKVLTPIGDRPLLGLMLDRLAPLQRWGARVIVATTVHDRDDAVVDLAERCGIAVVRGDEADVLARFLTALDSHGPSDDVVRLTADCPLIDPQLVAELVDVHRSTGADYTSNTLVRTYPDGLDVEVMRAEVLRQAADQASEASEREHVTPYVYRRPQIYRLAQVTADPPLGRERWTVDTAEDLDVIREAVASVESPSGSSWQELLHAVGERAPEPEDVVATPVLAQIHHAGTPFARHWNLGRGDGAIIGRAVVTVTDVGQGRLHFDLPPDLHHLQQAARAAVERWLTADLQVLDLIKPNGTT